MHLRNVEMFCDAVELRSFSRAAEQQKVSQSAVSQAIQQLEKRVGIQLIDRSKRPFELTNAGSLYFAGCRDLLHSFRDVEDRVRGMADRVVGRVRIAAIYSVGLLQINETIERFGQEYPDVEVNLDFVHPEEVYRRVESEKDELGLISFPKSKGRVFECLHWQDQPMVVVVGPNHRWSTRDTIEAADLQGQSFVGFQNQLSIRKQTDRWFKEVGVEVEIVHEFDNIEYVKRDVESGAGIALLPEPTIIDECNRGRLKSIEVTGVSWVRPMGIIHRRGREISLASRKLIEILQNECHSGQICSA